MTGTTSTTTTAGGTGAPTGAHSPAARAGVRVLAHLSDSPLDVGAHLAAVQDARAGAVATFVGQVRDHDPDVVGRVVALEYSAHPDAERVLAALAAATAEQDEVLGVAVSHRVGLLTVGEPAIVVAVATAHRAAAFEACAALVETVKAELPVWKREVLADGTHVWVGSA